MASTTQDLKQRTKEKETTMKTNNTANKSRKQKKAAMAKRGLRSLAIAITIPLFFTLANVFLFGSSKSYNNLPKPFWFPPLWALHLTSLVCSIIMGLSAWLVWAEGGFHKKPIAVGFYLGQLVLGMLWGPLVMWMGAIRVGLLVGLVLVGVMGGCYRVFKEVNPIAGDLVMPCLGWVGYLAIVNLKLMYL